MKSTLQIAQDALYNFFIQVSAFVPKLVGALIILIIAVGMYLGDFVEKIVIATLNSTGQSANAGTLASIAKGGVIFLTATIALSQLGIGGNVISTVVQSVFGGLALAFGIAFGMGGKDWAGGRVNKYLGK